MIDRRGIHRGHRGRGQSIVEFALVLPVLLFFLLGAIDLGRVFFTNVAVANAARAGAIRASETPADSSAIAAAVAKEAANVIEGEFAGLTCSTSGLVTTCLGNPQPAAEIVIRCEDTSGAAMACPAQPAPDARASVTVTVPFDFITPFISSVIGSGSLRVTSAGVADQLSLPTPITTRTSTTTTTTTTSTTTTTTTTTTVTSSSTAMCDVPSLDNLQKGSPLTSAWSGAGFLGAVALTYDYSNGGNSNSPKWYVKAGSQTLTAGTSAPCSSGVGVTVVYRP